MATIVPALRAQVKTNRFNNTYGLLTNEATAVMRRENITPVGEIMVVGRKGVFNLNMLYDWWMLYAIHRNIIKDGKWIVPNETIDALLADEYIKFGAQAGSPFHIQTYLRMIGYHLKYDHQLSLSPNQLDYLSNQGTELRNNRKQYKTTIKNNNKKQQ